MLTIILLMAFLSFFSFVLGFAPLDFEERPTLQTLGQKEGPKKKKKTIFTHIRKLAFINKPLCAGPVGKRMASDLARAHVDMRPEEFMIIKELSLIGCLALLYPTIVSTNIGIGLAVAIFMGFMLPEFWLKGKIKKVKASILRDLPDVIDLLSLCVNAGLDFMLALRWVIEKSPPSVLISELYLVMQEINVGKTRRDALRDLAAKYNDIADLASVTRTLIQADKMGTSVAEALNIISEDMREARYRRGEQIALKAPLKMLVPLLFCIFPVVAILVAGPVILDFMKNNPLKSGVTQGASGSIPAQQ